MRTLPLLQYLSTNGDGTGTTNAIGNYTTPDVFYIEPPAAQDYLVKRIIVQVSDASIKAGDYGALTALTNGVRVQAVLDSTTINLDGGVAIKTNANWGSICYDVDQKSWAATPTEQSLLVRFSFFKFVHDAAAPANMNGGILLQGHRDDQLKVTLSDNLTGLSIHRFMVQGTVLLDHISGANAP